MSTKERILTIRLMEKLRKHPACAEALKLEGAISEAPAACRTEPESSSNNLLN